MIHPAHLIAPFCFTARSFVALELAAAVYSTPAILRACYKFADRIHSLVVPADSDDFVVALWTRSGETVSQDFLGEFTRELNDQQLRHELAREAGPLREMIVAQAFAEGNLLDEGEDEADYEDDPHGIARNR